MYKPEYGYLTCLFRKEYMDIYTPLHLHNEIYITSLNANENTSDVLYFWQLYSLLGEENIKSFITLFYENVFNDQEMSDFSETFKKLGNLDYHITGQTNFWLDLMGGGKRYAGGQYRLTRHHNNAKQIMNENGAKRWLMHMKNALNNSLDIQHVDKRVKLCIIDFINFFTIKYGKEYNFIAKL